MTEAAFYRPEGEGFVASELTRGPWSVQHQHGGPPSALLVGRILRGHPEWQLSRVVVDFLRPVPIGPLRVVVEPMGRGRRAARVRAQLLDGQGEALAVASALMQRPAPMDPPPPPASPEPPLPPLSQPGGEGRDAFPFFQSAVGYHTAMELRFGRGRFGDGPVFVWMRQKGPLVAGEEVSGVERLMCAVDSVHGVSWRVDPRRMSAVNADLTVALHRQPAGEWMGLDAETACAPDGTGVAHSRLCDQAGALGWSLQALVLSWQG